MAEEKRVTSRLSDDLYSWLDTQTKTTGLSESHFIKKGLDIQRNNTRDEHLRRLLGPLVYMIIGYGFFVISIVFRDSMPVGILAVMLFGSVVVIGISCVGVVRVIRLQHVLKQKGVKQ